MLPIASQRFKQLSCNIFFIIENYARASNHIELACYLFFLGVSKGGECLFNNPESKQICKQPSLSKHTITSMYGCWLMICHFTLHLLFSLSLTHTLTLSFSFSTSPISGVCLLSLSLFNFHCLYTSSKYITTKNPSYSSE